ncbi:UNVERIFIED_CONTAM: NAC domain-containing protein 2 [Sesamum radiatum]|uniref:NAC domain-containing protein 2 n=1 Tax=Sesamum radiatum TaxID=300843 RepID=A0AAW2TKM5_SESRA
MDISKGKQLIQYHDDVDSVLFAEYGSISNPEEDEYVSSLPPGFKFRPTDLELLHTYLINKINNRPLPLNRFRDVNLYRFPTPEALTEKEWYFFTPQIQEYANGERPDRVTPGGYWKSTSADTLVRSQGGVVVGKKRTLCFYEGKPMAGIKTNWIMHEYRVDTPPAYKPANPMLLDDWVLCKVSREMLRRTRRTLLDPQIFISHLTRD